MPPMHDASERLFQDQVMQIAKMNGWLIFHPSPSQVRPGIWRSDGKGFPDLVLAHKDRGLIFAELKTRTGKLSEAQVEWGTALWTWAEWYEWRPADLEKIAERLGRKRLA